MALQIQFRRGTYAEWNSANPVLASGEFALQTDASSGVAAGSFKVGDGSTVWNSLSYGGIQGPQGLTAANVDGGLSNSTYTIISLDGGTSGAQ
jgi:hypothetical protein|tara:strand:- start:136 stop:414 length:279 start_codon:yes stop_codon:yes gene_type:complete